MQHLKKINRGLIVTIVILCLIAVYIAVVHSRVEDMEQKADILISDFLQKDSVWKVIPAEYRNNEAGYIEKLETEMRGFFADNGAYNYYIDNNISCQYREGRFCESYSADLYDFYDTNRAYNDISGMLSCEYTLSLNYRVSSLDSFEGIDNASFGFIESGGSLKISYIDYSISQSGSSYGDYYQYYDSRYGVTF